MRRARGARGKIVEGLGYCWEPALLQLLRHVSIIVQNNSTKPKITVLVRKTTIGVSMS